MNLNGSKPAWPRPVVAIPMERTITEHAFHAFMNIAKSGVEFFQLPYSVRQDVARDMFSKKLLASDFTHIIMLDSDHTHPVDIVERFVKWIIDDPDKVVIGGLNFKRSTPHDPCVFLPGENGEIMKLTEWPAGLLKVANAYGPGWLGSGSICIARTVFERIPGPWWRYNYSGYDLEHFPGVDIYFSELCHKYNIDLWLDTELTSPHLVIGGIDFATYQANLNLAMEETPKETKRVSIGGHISDV